MIIKEVLMNNFRYIIEQPNFIYPRQELYDYQNNHNGYKENIHFKKARNLNTATECKFFDLTDINNIHVQEVLSTLNCKDGKFTKVVAGGIMPAHIDPQRTAVLMLPLTDTPSPIVFYEGDKEIFKHIYIMPTIINAKIKHGVPEVKTDRIFLQINFYEPCNEILERFYK